MKRVAGWLGLALLAAGLGAALVASFARVSALAEVVANLRFPIGLLALAGAGLTALGGRRAVGIAGLVLALVLAWPTLRLWWPRAAAAAGAVELRVATANLLFGRVLPEEVEAFADEFDPDVLGLLEVLEENRTGTDWRATLERWRARWPHQVALPHGHSFGMALLSKHPLEDIRWLDPPGGENVYALRPGLLRATALVEGRPVRLVLTHPDRPGRAWRVRARAAIFDAIVGIVGPDGPADLPAVVFGDLNCTESSPLFRDLVDRAALLDTRRGFGPCFSWRHERVPGRWVTLDHVLVSSGVGVLERGTGRSIGSDHRPAVARLAIPR